MDHLIGTLALALFIAVSALPARSDPGPVMNATIVKADSTAWLADRAVEELSNYIEKMTGAEVRIVKEKSLQKKGGIAFVLSLYRAVDKLERLPGCGNPEQFHDGFVIQSQGEARLLRGFTLSAGYCLL